MDKFQEVMITLIFVLYIFIGIITFGNAASNYKVLCTDQSIECISDNKNQPNVAFQVGIGWGILWPLYWSWQLQKGK